MKPAMFDRILQRAGQDFLPGYVFKFLWAPLARDYLVGHIVTLDSRLPISDLKCPDGLFSESHITKIGQTPDLPATHAAVATVAPFPAWRGSQGERCAEPEV